MFFVLLRPFFSSACCFFLDLTFVSVVFCLPSAFVCCSHDESSATCLEIDFSKIGPSHIRGVYTYFCQNSTSASIISLFPTRGVP